ncbi:primase-like DNA-binding domain-containing protein [Rahnella sp. ChDrAdgB13]|uniref:DNA primase family protein n=1 Tax=Rahnella sp. ChDrAdgB13 TaxID=1850581 RepID=UPI001AD88BB3|nr:primase-like DNA-binding domain-containing protein [Rahnella sp. ChDrAdgB13]
MKNAPNVKHLPKDKFTEAIIFAGADALSHVQHWTEKAGNEAGDKIPPIYLGARQLAELDNLRIIDKGRRYVRVYRAGDISPAHLLAIETRLALADVKEARLFDGIHEQKPAEDWTPRLAGLKEEAGRGESLVDEMRKADGDKFRQPVKGDLSRMAASERGRLLAQRYGEITVNPDSQVAYAYDGSTWQRVADSELQREMVAIFNENEVNYSPVGIKNAIDAMKLEIPVVGKPRRELIGFENGVYDLTNKEFLPHSPEHWLMNHNGITFTDPASGESLRDHAPYFSKWLVHAAGNDLQKENRIKAALFMVLANRHDWQLFIEVTGEGGSGKSVFTAIALILAGEHNTASGSMSSLDSARGRAQFVGKNLIIMPDQTRYVGEGAGIKAITGGDPVEIDGKYEKQFTTVINAVVIATNNEPMAFTERNGGIARRRVIFPFDIPVKEADRDPDLMAKIRCEMPVIIRCLLSEFANQNRAKTCLTDQRDSAEAMGVKRHTDPLYGFCEHIIALGEAVGMLMGNLNISPRAPRIYLYHAYLAYMDAHGFDKHLTLTRFGSDFPKVMKEYGAEYKKAKTMAGMRYNMDLAESAYDWLPAVPRMHEHREE